MATTFVEPGGDATFNVATTANGGFWDQLSSTPSVATDFVNGSHIKSIQYAVNTVQFVHKQGVTPNAGSRISMYVYFNALPSANATIIQMNRSGFGAVLSIRLTSAGVLQIADDSGTQVGTNGATLSTGVWYRISLAYTIKSITVNEIRLYVNGAISISVTNGTLSYQSAGELNIGNILSNLTLDMRSSDHYVDNSNALTDTGDIWVTAKRPNANGTTNGFTTQIGSGGSGYGTGHSSQVNERPLSTTNGWSRVGAGSAVTEEYNIEAKATGDIDISTATIVDYLGWVSTSALVGETVQMIVNGVNFAQAITSTTTLYTKIAGSTTYPAGTGADIGITTDTSLTTVSLYESGIIVAYIPLKAITGVTSITGLSTITF